MATLRNLHTNFRSGVVDRKLFGRTDIEHYYNGAEILENVLIRPQGGVYRRPGTKINLTVLDSGLFGTTAVNREFKIQEDATYQLIMHDHRIDVWNSDASTLVEQWVDTSEGGSDTVPYGDDILEELNFIFLPNAVLILHPDYESRLVGKDAAGSWDYDTASFTNIPRYAFTPSVETPAARLKPSNESGTIRLKTFGTGSWSAPATTLSLSQFYGSDVTATAGASAFVSGDVGKYIIGKDGQMEIKEYVSATVVKVNIYDAVTSTSLASGEWQMSPAPSSQFTADDVGGYIQGNGGEARIISYLNGFEVEAIVTIDFIDSAFIEEDDWSIERGYEDIWSSTEGWPGCGTFYNGRLWLGGSKSIPNALLGSVIADPLNFDIGIGLDDEAIFREADRAIRHIETSDRLLVFTNGYIYFIPNERLTPSNLVLTKTDNKVVNSAIPPIFVDGTMFFNEASTDRIFSTSYDSISEVYSSEDISLLAESLINSPVGIAHYRANNDRRIDILVGVNGTGGRCFAVHTMRNQTITAITGIDMFVGLPEGAAEVKSIAGIDNKLFAIVSMEQPSSGSNKLYLVEFDVDEELDMVYLDTSGTPRTSVTGLPFPDDTVVYVRGESGTYHPVSYTVQAGAITLQESEEDVEIGPFSPCRIKMLPVERELPDGPMFGRKRRISKVEMDVKDTGDLLVNGVRVPLYRFGENPFTEAPLPFTGLVRQNTFNWSYAPQTDITQEEPSYLEIYSVLQEVTA